MTRRESIAGVAVFAIVASGIALGACSSDSDPTTDEAVATTTSEAVATTTSEAVATTTSEAVATTTASTDPTQDPVLVESAQWFTEFEHTEDTFSQWVMIWENPNSDWQLEDVFLEVDLLDADDNVIDSEFVSTPFMQPHSQAVFTGAIKNDNREIVNVDWHFNYGWTNVAGQDLGEFKTTGTEYWDNYGRGWQFTGNLHSTFINQLHRNVGVFVVMRDASGQIIDVAQTGVPSIAAHTLEIFDAETVSEVLFDSFEVYVTP